MNKLTPETKEIILLEADQAIEFLTDQLERYNTLVSQITESRLRFDNSDFDELHDNINCAGTLLIGLLDAHVILKGIFNSKHDWEKIYYTRTSRLLIHEVVESYTKYSNQIRQKAKSMTVTKDSLIDCSKKLKNFKRKYDYQKQLKDFRNNTIGHISIDFKKVYDLIVNIDINDSALMLRDFIDWVNSVQVFYNLYLKSLNLPEKQVSEEFFSETIERLKEIGKDLKIEKNEELNQLEKQLNHLVSRAKK
ncbi:hypothetical protein BXY85_3626 [Roseivirga pacifica]|uniref:HEPN AbiU2-like domain-containing protein n=1 Tax=Roseivirga pacifica TaxID=1267423 RepID=A0A1I0QEP2_9BACT|nr:hypothetical protein [Roseivirga pacifica]RKQ43007.1 hypothetical protein BXY85_3626 [Roseivirga pacifica]SEW25293.1 hypothetical protein SAMN05216290_2249 [Roseivirga pacifica]